MASDGASGRGCGTFVGGPFDGEESPGDRRGAGWWFISEGHSYQRQPDGPWLYVGAECPGCHSVISPDERARIPDDCPLCGAAIPGLEAV